MPTKIKQAAVVGAGLMGSAIARQLAAHDLALLLIDTSESQLKKAAEHVGDLPIECTTDFSRLGEVDFVMEAVFEDLQAKLDVLQTISSYVRADCIIGTNTSSLLVGDLAAGVTHPGRFLGVHYNNPADFNPIVEIIAASATNQSVADTIFSLISASGKQAIRCADTSGFILNRQSLPYLNEAARCVADGVATEGEVDFIATSQLGVGLGPFAVMNLVGLPVMAAASRNLAILGHGYEPADLLQSRAGSENPQWEIAPVNDLDSARGEALRQRLVAAMIFPGQDILKQQLVDPDDLHLICTVALGYKTSSPQLLEQLGPESEELIDNYLNRL